MFNIQSHFIGDFKTGDNIVDNFRILKVLYLALPTTDPFWRKCLNKPIIIIMGSIAEAVLHDWYMKINSYHNEGVVNIAKDKISRIRGKEIDKFGKYIDVASSEDIFCPSTPEFYEALHELRELRNRVHLHKHRKKRDWNVFDDETRVRCEKVLERLLRRMVSSFPREMNFVNTFEVPWEPHFPYQG